MCGKPDRMTWVLETYKQAHELHRHQDKMRFSFLNIYFVCFLGVMAAVARIGLSPEIQGAVLLSVLVFGLVCLCVLFSEHLYLLRYKRWLAKIEKALPHLDDLDDDGLASLSYSRNDELRSGVQLGIRPTLTFIFVLYALTAGLLVFTGLTKLNRAMRWEGALGVVLLYLVVYFSGVKLHDLCVRRRGGKGKEEAEKQVLGQTQTRSGEEDSMGNQDGTAGTPQTGASA